MTDPTPKLTAEDIDPRDYQRVFKLSGFQTSEFEVACRGLSYIFSQLSERTRARLWVELRSRIAPFDDEALATKEAYADQRVREALEEVSNALAIGCTVARLDEDVTKNLIAIVAVFIPAPGEKP